MKYVRQISNGNLFPFDSHQHLLGEAGKGRYDLFSEGEPTVEAPPAEPEGEERLAAVLKAVYAVPAENYGKNGRPNVGTVSELAGFKVSVEEIVAAMEQTK